MYYLLGHRLMELPISVDRKEVMAENTYLLTLDGDIDFQPHAVRLLIDLMKKNKNLGAACGRIHPVGSGMIIGRLQVSKGNISKYLSFNEYLWLCLAVRTLCLHFRSHGMVSTLRICYRSLAAKGD